MHVEVTPRRIDATPGMASEITITVSNTDTVIGGYAIRLLGADPTWVEIPEPEFSLFPDETRSLVARVTVPPGIPAGERRFAVQTRELTPPESSQVEEVVLAVPEARGVRLRVDPVTVTAGRTARYGVLVDNTGNTPLNGQLAATDAESKVRFTFEPATLSLGPGEHAVVDMRASARRPIAGSPVVRVLDLHLDEAPPGTAGPPGARRTKDVGPAPARPGPPLGNATFLQRSVVSRGLLSLLGLLAALSVFALVITLAMSKIVGQSTADRNLALEIAAAQDAAADGTGSSSVAGTVILLTSRAPVEGVTVNVYDVSDTESPIATKATGADGTYRIGDLPAGDYKLTFRGAGFVPLWYPQALNVDDAKVVKLKPGASQAGLDVTLGGVPASISGTVVGDDVSAATLTLRKPNTVVTTTPGSADDATVKSVPIGSDGTFTLTDVPSPSVYDLVVTKTGYATSTQRIDVSAGEAREDVTITLRKGDGIISGTVGSATGPLGNVSLTATSGQTTVSTVSVTKGATGAFMLRGLPTPGSYTVVARRPGYAAQTLTLTLSEGQKLTGVSITLSTSSGSLTGTVELSSDQTAAPGVAVTITDGKQTVQTVTQSEVGSAGIWEVGSLAVPATYTITFTRSDLESQTVSVSLDASGNITPGSQGATIDPTGIRVQMRSATAVVYGDITQYLEKDSSVTRRAGEVTVQLTSGSSTYTVTTATVPTEKAGSYRFEGLPPGTYTATVSRNGVSPISEIITLVAGEEREYNQALQAAASISGHVLGASGNGVGAGWTVELFRASSYPGTVYRSTTTVEGGAYSFGDLDAPETYIIQARPTRGSTPAGSLTVQLLPSYQLTDRDIRTRISDD